MKISEVRRIARFNLQHNIFGRVWMKFVGMYFIGMLYGIISNFIPFGDIVYLFFMVPPLDGALSHIGLKNVRGDRNIKVGELHSCFSSEKYGPFIRLGLLKALYIFLWSLLLVIPGIIKAYSYSMSYFIKVDHPEYSAKQCLAESCRMMEGNKWRLCVLLMSFFGWLIVGSLTIIGNLWVFPYMFVSTAVFYEDIKNPKGIPWEEDCHSGITK